MATGHGVGRGGCCLARGGFTTAIFPKKCRDTWPWPGCERASHTIGHENATFYGFIMRMVDQGGSRGMRRNTWLLLSTGFQVAEHCVYMYRYSAYVCTHVCTLHTRELVRAMGWPLFDCPPRNRVMSRHVGRLCSPIKSISENSRGELVFFSRPNVIHHTSRPSSSERGAPLARLFLPVVDSRPFRPSRLV